MAHTVSDRGSWRTRVGPKVVSTLRLPSGEYETAIVHPNGVTQLVARTMDRRGALSDHARAVKALRKTRAKLISSDWRARYSDHYPIVRRPRGER